MNLVFVIAWTRSLSWLGPRSRAESGRRQWNSKPMRPKTGMETSIWRLSFSVWKSNRNVLRVKFVIRSARPSDQMSKIPIEYLYFRPFVRTQRERKISIIRCAQLASHIRNSRKATTWLGAMDRKAEKIKFESHCTMHHSAPGTDWIASTSSPLDAVFGRFVHRENKRECKLGTSRICWVRAQRCEWKGHREKSWNRDVFRYTYIYIKRSSRQRGISHGRRAREKRITRRRQTDASSAHSFLSSFFHHSLRSSLCSRVFSAAAAAPYTDVRSQFMSKNIRVSRRIARARRSTIAISLQLFRQQYTMLTEYVWRRRSARSLFRCVYSSHVLDGTQHVRTMHTLANASKLIIIMNRHHKCGCSVFVLSAALFYVCRQRASSAVLSRSIFSLIFYVFSVFVPCSDGRHHFGFCSSPSSATRMHGQTMAIEESRSRCINYDYYSIWSENKIVIQNNEQQQQKERIEDGDGDGRW